MKSPMVMMESLAMVLGLFTAGSVAAADLEVAKIGETRFSSLHEAFASDEAKVAGAKIELLGNVGLTEELDIVDFDGTLDLGGHEISNDVSYVASGYDWLIDLYVSDESKTCSLTLTNGTVTLKDGHMFYVCAGATLTVAADATIREIATATCTSPFRCYSKIGGHTGESSDIPGTVNVYGTMTRTEVEGNTGGQASGVIEQSLGTSVVNVYDGAVLSHVPGRVFKMSGGTPTVNVHGGTLTAGGEMFHATTRSNTVSIAGGEFTMSDLFSSGTAGKTLVVSGLGEGCTARFSTTSSQYETFDSFCDKGYGPILVGDWYTIGRTDTANDIRYLDYDEATGTMTNAAVWAERCTVVTAETRTLTNGWYAVVDDVVLPEGANLTVSGSAHLILCDGASLTVTNTGDHVAGICVVDANCLTIYGQEAGTGVLMAQGGEYCAGIGGFADGSGRDEPDCGTVTIIGGTVVATGGLGAAGIGCSPMGRGGHVAIHGGTVTATSGTGGTGIGCCEDILVPPKDGSEVVITGGKVSATGLRYDIHQKDIHFASLSISGGVFARRPEDGWCAEHFTVFANSDSATSGDYPYAVLPSRTVTVGDLPAHVAAAWTSGEGTVTNASAGASFAVPYGAENVRVIFTAEPGWEIVGDAEVDLGTVTDDITFSEGNDYRVPEARYLLGDIPYLDWDGTQMTNAALPKYVFTFVTDRTRELTNGWYAVTNDVVFPMGANLVVNGSAHLVLCDGASLTITNAVGAAAVAVPEEARLAIYGQEAGTGALVARGGVQCAGIGGGAPVSPMTSGWTPELIYGHCGTVAIHGGTVTAEGSNGGAGVGGGDGGNGGTVTVSGGTVTVSGGTVTATGTDGGAGIGGGGMGGEGGTVTIYDGAVSASGGANLEGIGPGWGYIGDASKSGTVTIFGGIFAQAPRDAWLADDHAVIANQDVMTVAAYPWAVVPYPAAWPAADDAVKAKFGAWRNGAGAEAVLSTDDAKDAFLENVAVDKIKNLKIESIDVDADGNATIVVGAPGAFFFDRVDLGNINGVLYVLAGDTLDTMEPKSVAHWTTTMGKANITVKAHFIRAAIGFQTPEVPAD